MKTNLFRDRLLGGERLLGSFVKTPTPHATEILGLVSFDFVVIDEEHAPFSRSATDMALLGARAGQIAALCAYNHAAMRTFSPCLIAGLLESWFPMSRPRRRRGKSLPPVATASVIGDLAFRTCRQLRRHENVGSHRCAGCFDCGNRHD